MRSISLAIMADVDRGGVVDCPGGIKVTAGKGKVIAFENPWSDCVPNALNTVLFADPATITANSSTTGNGYEVESDFLQVTLSDKHRLTTAVTEIQIWVEPEAGPRYELEDGLIGTFIGSFEGRATGFDAKIKNGGVSLGDGGWAEIANVRTPTGNAGRTNLTLSGGGQGTVEVQLNWLRNHTVALNGAANKSIEVDMLRGGNVVTVLQTKGEPFVDAITVQ
jgi:hypothetical protein